jgi:hypothetical protein
MMHRTSGSASASSRPEDSAVSIGPEMAFKPVRAVERQQRDAVTAFDEQLVHRGTLRLWPGRGRGACDHGEDVVAIRVDLRLTDAADGEQLGGRARARATASASRTLSVATT